MWVSLSPLLGFVLLILSSFSELFPLIGKFRQFLLGVPFATTVIPFVADGEDLLTALGLLEAADKLPGTADLPRTIDELLGTALFRLWSANQLP